MLIGSNISVSQQAHVFPIKNPLESGSFSYQRVLLTYQLLNDLKHLNSQSSFIAKDICVRTVSQRLGFWGGDYFLVRHAVDAGQIKLFCTHQSREMKNQ